MGSEPLTDDELIALRACLHDEVTQPEGADPHVHGLYDYYETTKRLVSTVEHAEARATALMVSRDDIQDRYRRLRSKVEEYRAEAARCRMIARKLADARGTNAVLAGVWPDKRNPGGILAFICAPNLDEGNLADALRMTVREFWDGVARNSNGEIPPSKEAGLSDRSPPRVTGTEADNA